MARPDARHNVASIDAGKHRARVIGIRDALIENHLYLVPPIARRIFQTLPPSFDLDDLIQAGNVALLHLATRYRPDAHPDVPFAAFATPRLRFAILESVRRRNYTAATAVPIAEAPEQVVSIDVEAIDRRRFYQRCIEHPRLTAEQREVLRAYYTAEMPSLKQVAEVLNISDYQAFRAHQDAIRTLRDDKAA